MTKVYKVYTRKPNEDWKERHISFTKPNKEVWFSTTQDVRFVEIDIPNEERIIYDRKSAEQNLNRVCYCENCKKAVTHGDELYLYTEFFPDLEDGYAIKNNYYFCCQACANEFVRHKIRLCTKSSSEYNYAHWEFVDEDKPHEI